MSPEFELATYKEHCTAFDNAKKKILIFVTDKTRTLPTELSSLVYYKNDIVEAFNALLSYICDHYSNLGPKDKQTLENKIKRSIELVKQCFGVLGYDYTWSPTLFAQITINDVKRVTPSGQANVSRDSVSTATDATEEINNLPNTSQKSVQSIAAVSQKQNQGGETVTQREPNSVDVNNNQKNTGGENSSTSSGASTHITDDSDDSDTFLDIFNKSNKMVQSKAEFMKLASSILNYKFDGTPEDLEGFLTDVALVEDICEAGNEGLCLKFIKAKIEKKAAELIPADPKTIKEITDVMSDNIHYETSAVIECRMLALRLGKGNFARRLYVQTR